MTATDTQATGQSLAVSSWRRNVNRIQSVFPFQSVILPWLVARILVLPLLLVNTTPEGGVRPAWLLAMDGGWFRAIALDWYDRHDGASAGGIGEYPFFPLFPSAGGALMRLGVPSTVALAGLAWVGALVAMAGARVLAARHLGDGAARLAPWVIALAPGGLSLILGYADSIYLAALIWAVVAADQRRWWFAGAFAALATASRPNGAIAVVAVVVIAVGLKANRRQVAALILPSIAFLAAWMTYLGVTTGEPMLFWTAKSEWLETTFFEFITDPLAQRSTLFHVICLAILLAPFVMRVRRQPPAWSVVVVLGVAPALALGVVGVARYAVLAFPLPIVAAEALAERPRWVRILALSISAISLMVLARLVVMRNWVP